MIVFIVILCIISLVVWLGAGITSFLAKIISKFAKWVFIFTSIWILIFVVSHAVAGGF